MKLSHHLFNNHYCSANYHYHNYKYSKRIAAYLL